MDTLVVNRKGETDSPNILHLFDDLRSRLVSEARQIQDLQEALRKKEEGTANYAAQMTFLSGEVLRLKKELETEKTGRAEAESKFAQLGRLVLTSVKFSFGGGALSEFKDEGWWPEMFRKGNLVDNTKLSEVTDLLFADPPLADGELPQPDVLAHDDGVIKRPTGLKKEAVEVSTQKSVETSLAIPKKPQPEDDPSMGAVGEPSSSGIQNSKEAETLERHNSTVKYGRDELLKIGHGQNIARFEVSIPELRRVGPKTTKGIGKQPSTGSGASIGIPRDELPWVKIDKCKDLSKEMLQILKPRIDAESFPGIQRIFQQNDWDLEKELTVQALTEVICRLTFNPAIGKWKEAKVNQLFAILISLVDRKMYPVVAEQRDDFGRRMKIGEEEMNRQRNMTPL